MREILFSVSTRPDGSLIGENAAMRIAISGLDRDELEALFLIGLEHLKGVR